jgi:lauroyl/myristoyl acyltransferase
MPDADAERVPLYRFLGPRYWPVWLGIGLVRTVNLLPLRAQLFFGRMLGSLAWLLSRRDRRIATRPAQRAARQNALSTRHIAESASAPPSRG